MTAARCASPSTRPRTPVAVSPSRTGTSPGPAPSSPPSLRDAMALRPFEIGARPQLALAPDLRDSPRAARRCLRLVSKHPTPVLAPEPPWEGPGRGALWGPLHAERDAETGRVGLWYQSFDLYPGR